MSTRDRNGRAALVTGASRGIGAAAALRLAADGYDVALVQRGAAAETAAAVEGLGRRAVVVVADLADADAAAAAVDEAADRLGRIDALVANAGTIHREPALDVTVETLRQVVELNLVSPFAVAQAAARRFLAQGGGGAIVFTASVLSYQGGVNVVPYAVSKAGVANLARALANEWASLGIRVNAVAPGYVETEMTGALQDDAARRPAITARIPIGRWATPEDIAGAISFLLSDDAGYVHGHVLAADGGWLAR